ncbi:hypothetical protein BC833DRAFT_612299 [Globomyces pollinis-pini]|nr:hypothetical protein BC833DRAFT_612299 [Globomyces pollinis-pini]
MKTPVVGYIILALLSLSFLFALSQINLLPQSNSDVKTKPSLEALQTAIKILNNCYQRANFVMNNNHVLLHNQIPKIIHQNKVEESHANYKAHRTWKDSHPFWEHKAWTDEDNDALCKDEFPKLYSRYKSLPTTKKQELARFLYMYKFGGIYVDTDVVCVKTNRPLNFWGGAILASMSSKSFDKKDNFNIPASWLASVPNHPLWKYTIDYLSDPKVDIQSTPTSVLLFEAYTQFSKKNHNQTVHLLDPGHIFPYDWRAYENGGDLCSIDSKNFNQDKCIEKFQSHQLLAIKFWPKNPIH